MAPSEGLAFACLLLSPSLSKEPVGSDAGGLRGVFGGHMVKIQSTLLTSTRTISCTRDDLNVPNEMGPGGLDLFYFPVCQGAFQMKAKHPVGELVDRSADQQKRCRHGLVVARLTDLSRASQVAGSLDSSLAQNSDGGFDPVPCACL